MIKNDSEAFFFKINWPGRNPSEGVTFKQKFESGNDFCE